MSGEVKPKAEGEPNIPQRQKRKNYSKATYFTAPTSGMERASFDYGPGRKPGKFKYNAYQIAEFMANDLK